jgi:hypothetical protein
MCVRISINKHVSKPTRSVTLFNFIHVITSLETK